LFHGWLVGGFLRGSSRQFCCKARCFGIGDPSLLPLPEHWRTLLFMFCS
jgi:hypothetical protein